MTTPIQPKAAADGSDVPTSTGDAIKNPEPLSTLPPLPKKQIRFHFETDDLFDNMAGMPNNGLYVSGITYNGDDTYTLSGGGLSTGYAPNGISNAPWTPTRFNVGMDISRIEERRYSNGSLYVEHGPRFSLDLSYTPYMVHDLSVSSTASTAQLQAMRDNTASNAAGAVDTTPPDCSLGLDPQADQECLDAYTDWLNSNRTGLQNLADIISGLGDGYDPSQDVSGSYNIGAYHQVDAWNLGATIWLGGESRNYAHNFGLFDSAHLGMTVSALYFTNHPFVTNFYAGLGAQAEAAVVSYYPFKPRQDERAPPAIDLVLHAGLDYYRGYDKGVGFKGYSMFGNAFIGGGVKISFPPLTKKDVERYYDTATRHDLSPPADLSF